MTTNNYFEVFNEIYQGLKYHFSRIILRKEIIRPLMKSREINIFLEIMNKSNPKNILEWGCGYSTLYFTKFMKKRSSWISIEHNKEWADKVKTKNKNTNIKIFDVGDSKNNYLNLEKTTWFSKKLIIFLQVFRTIFLFG